MQHVVVVKHVVKPVLAFKPATNLVWHCLVFFWLVHWSGHHWSIVPPSGPPGSSSSAGSVGPGCLHWLSKSFYLVLWCWPLCLLAPTWVHWVPFAGQLQSSGLPGLFWPNWLGSNTGWKKTSLFFHPVDLWSTLGLGSGLDLGSTGLDELLAVEGMVGGCGKWLGAAEVGHACMCGAGAAYGFKIGIGIGCGMLAGSPHPGPGWTVLGAVACCGCHPATGWIVLGAGACCGAIGCWLHLAVGLSCGVFALLAGMPVLLGGVLGAIFPRSGLRFGDGDLGFLSTGVLGAGTAHSTNDGFAGGCGCCWKTWSATCWPNSYMAWMLLASWSSSSMAFCSSGLHVTLSMVGVGDGAGVFVVGELVMLVELLLEPSASMASI